MSLGARILDRLIALYQLIPRGPVQRCRFYPTCSQYGREALATHGAGRGAWLTIKRVGRCHPFHPGGIDHVPPREGRDDAEGVEPWTS